MVGEDAVTFRCSFPAIQSAVKVSGSGGMRIQLDIPESELARAVDLLAWRQKVLVVTVRPERRGSDVKRVGDA